MPATKRTSKAVSYNEQDDDDDFIPIVDNTKKNRINKSKDSSKSVTKQPSPKKPEPVIIEIDDEESQSTVSSDDSKTSDIDDQEENLSPKIKRMKHDEEDDTDENEDESITKTDEPTKKADIPIMSSSDLNTSGNCSTRTSDLPKRNSSIPLGFPTSKINIPSPHVSRVGLSRKSSTIKPLHPNITSRVIHE